MAADKMVEPVVVCPLCGGDGLEPIGVANLNSRDPLLTERLAKLVGGDWFVHQRLALCAECGHLFQAVRPTQAGLAALYDHFAAALAKKPPSTTAPLTAMVLENRKDYIELPGRSLHFLRSHKLLDGARSFLELRTYGGVLAALVREQGVPHIEVGAMQAFDGEVARGVFDISLVVDFSFARPLAELAVSRGSYDLIAMYEGLTHAFDPVASLRWIRDHLSDSGAAVLFREPNTPAYRRDFPLHVVFNNFHLHLFDATTLAAAVAEAGGLTAELHEEDHPQFGTPLYLTAILRRGEPVAAARDPDGTRELVQRWLRRDGSPLRRKTEHVSRALKRRAKLLLP